MAYKMSLNRTKFKFGLLHFVPFFHVASMFSTGVDKKKMSSGIQAAMQQNTNYVVKKLISSFLPDILCRKIWSGDHIC